MMRIAGSFGMNYPNSYVTPTGIIFSLCGTEQTKLVQISKRSTDLYKVIIVNSISRKISNGEISAEEAYFTLRKIEKENLKYPIYVKIIAASIVSGFSLVMFNGEWNDFFSAFLAGGAGFLCVSYIHRLVDIKFFTEFLAALLVGLMSYSFKYIGFGHDLSNIIVASIYAASTWPSDYERCKGFNGRASCFWIIKRCRGSLDCICHWGWCSDCFFTL